jgi:hypothetical protein
MSEVATSEQDSEQPQQLTSDTIGGRFRWLTDPQRGWLLPLSGLWILALDWLLFSSNVLTVGLATPIVAVIGFVVGGAGTFLVQRRVARDNVWNATLKGIVAGVAVGMPWPLSGTLVGGWVLLASGITRARK